MRTKASVQLGDKVRLSGAFLKSTGQTAGGEGQAVWTVQGSVRAVPTFYKCRTCPYWHPARDKVCRPARNGYTVAVLDAMYPDRDGDHFADWQAVKEPRRRIHKGQEARP